MEALYIILAFAIGYIAGHRRGTIQGLKQLDKILNIPPGRTITGISYGPAKRKP